MSRQFITISVVLLWLTSGAYGERSLLQRELKTYALHEYPNSADISPDEAFVVTELSRSKAANNPSTKQISDLVQLWDFRNDKLVAEYLLQSVTRDEHDTMKYVRSQYVRFSIDGSFVIACVDRVLYLLRASDLQEIRRISIDAPPPETHTYTGKQGVHTFVLDSHITHFELSPVRPEVAVVWTRGFDSSWIDIVDFDSGKQMAWNTSNRGLGVMSPTAISWTNDGEHLVVAEPNTFACSRPFNLPDVFEVNPHSGSIEKKLTTGLLVGDVAVTPDGRVFAVDFDCVGVFANHDPKLRIFDLQTGKKLKELPGRGTGVRYEVSVSRNGSRIAAYTGLVKTAFDWGDMVANDKLIDKTFTVWNSTTYEMLVTSQMLPSKRGYPRFRTAGEIPLRMSPRGNFVLQGQTIYELP